MVKFKEGHDLIVDEQATFGELEFIELGREVHDYDEDGVVIESKRRVYDLLCDKVGSIIEVSLDWQYPEVTLPRETVVTLINPKVRMFNASGQARSYVTAEGIVPASMKSQPQAIPENKLNKPHQPNK